MDRITKENSIYLVNEMRKINSNIELKVVGNKFLLLINGESLTLQPMKYSELYGFRCGFLTYHKVFKKEGNNE